MMVTFELNKIIKSEGTGDSKNEVRLVVVGFELDLSLHRFDYSLEDRHVGLEFCFDLRLGKFAPKICNSNY